MQPLSVPDAHVLSPTRSSDARGSFLEWFRADAVERLVGRSFPLAQANCSVSRRGVVRGLHVADVPPGQAKYVTCVRGAVRDVVVDLRVGSPAFGRWDSVCLDDVEGSAVYLAEGLGHGFEALTDEATVVYLCSEPYAPDREHAVSPLDPVLALPWSAGLAPVLSERDAAAPTLQVALEAGLLPSYDACRAWYDRPPHE